MQLALIQIAHSRADKAIVLNGNIIYTTDPVCDASIAAAAEVASNLQATLHTPLSHIEVTPSNDWQWANVIQTLKAEKKLLSPTISDTTVVLDTVIKDWRLNDAEEAPYVPVQDRCEYALRIEKDIKSEKLWVALYNKAFDEHGTSLYKAGLHCAIEITNGLPTLSVGVGPDEHVMHILSNTSNALAVVPDQDDPMPTWVPIEFIEAKHLGYRFSVDDHETLMEARSELANACFAHFDFGERIVVDDSGWEIDDAVWQKSVFFEDEQGNNAHRGQFELTFTDNGTHIIHAQER
jgi:hypothetical protein